MANEESSCYMKTPWRGRGSKVSSATQRMKMHHFGHSKSRLDNALESDGNKQLCENILGEGQESSHVLSVSSFCFSFIQF